MLKIQIVGNENLIKYADFDNCEVWLLNRVTTEPLDERIINIQELTESLEVSSIKFPQLMTFIYEKHEADEFDYEVITDNRDNFMIHCYVCDPDKFATL